VLPSAAQLDTPRDIAWSLPKLVVRSVIGVACVLLFFWALSKLIVLGRAGGFYRFPLVLGLLGGLLGLWPTWAGWRGHASNQPAVSISRLGLTFAGQPLIPWFMIAENCWGDGREPFFLHIRIRGTDGLLPVSGKVDTRGYYSFDVTTIQCSRRQYMDSCHLYQTATSPENNKREYLDCRAFWQNAVALSKQ
jgi:hypothetical protein